MIIIKAIVAFVIFALLTAGGGAYGFWRLYVSVRTGEVWLSNAKFERETEPVAFWIYAAFVAAIAFALATLFGFGLAFLLRTIG